MMNSLPTISLKLTQQRYTCVLDPTLALSRYGLTLVKQLGTVMDLWLGREFWNILDNTQFYLQHPESLLPRNINDSTRRQEIIQSLTIWEQMQNETGLTNFHLFRIGDRLVESWLPEGIEPEIMRNYEFLGHSLANYIHPDGDPETNIAIGDPLSSLFQDTVALAATLDSCFVLTFQSPQDITRNLSPEICTTIENWGIPCQAVTLEDEIAAIERHHLRKLIVNTGLAKFLWSGLNMVVLHLLVPTALPIKFLSIGNQERFFPNVESDTLHSGVNPWEFARCFWYQL